MIEKKRIDIHGIDGAIFDMDGVITQTVNAHYKAWKTMLNEFLQNNHPVQRELSENDYKKYLDGLPRYEGVSQFLKSRKIKLEKGNPNDNPEKKTICGLGNLKNKLLLKEIRKNGVEIFDDTIERIKQWRLKGIKIAVVSSSKNCEEILNSAGISHLFDARVDGVDIEEKTLEGKPSPDIFLKAAKQLKINPNRTIVFEDAVSGVKAGKNGKFAFTIGVARNNNKWLLYNASADLVIENIYEVDVTHDPDKPIGFCQHIPELFPKKERLTNALKNKKPFLFLDYDGTLSTIVNNPEEATISPDMKNALQKVAKIHNVAVVSGRDMNDVISFIELPNLIYAGSHGYRVSGPNHMHFELKEAEKLLPDIANIESALKNELEKDYVNVKVERKRYAIAVHFRNEKTEYENDIIQTVKRITESYPAFKNGEGKKIIEVKPDIDWHKGKAIQWILETIPNDKKNTVPIYIGDDVTDEDGFRAISGRGIGILVGSHAIVSAADFKVKDIDEVKQILEILSSKFSNE